jgi:hypothetical protein
MGVDQPDVRDDWWQVLLLTPIAVIIGGMIDVIGVFLMIGFAIAYPIALYKDSIYVSQTSDWEPNPRLYAVIGLVVMVTFGLLSYIISPIYIFLRYKRT